MMLPYFEPCAVDLLEFQNMAFDFQPPIMALYDVEFPGTRVLPDVAHWEKAGPRIVPRDVKLRMALHNLHHVLDVLLTCDIVKILKVRQHVMQIEA